MAKKRVQHEIKIIIILAVLSVLFYGLTFGIRAIRDHQTDETQEYIDKATMVMAPHTVKVFNDKEPFTLQKTDGKWSCLEDEEIPVSSLKITMMRTVLKYFAPVRVIMDAKDRWAEFGLDSPQSIITLTSDEKTNTYLVGDYNPVLDEYYMAMEGEDVVFLLSGSDMNDFNLDILGYVHEPETAELESKNIKSIKVESADDNYDITISGSTFTVDTGKETFEAGQYTALTILSTFTSAAYRCVDHKVTADGMAKYGLDKPAAKVTFTDKDGTEYVMAASQGDDGKFYVNENGNGLVYQIEQRVYENLLSRIQTDNLRG